MNRGKWLRVAATSAVAAATVVRHWLGNFGNRRASDTDATALLRLAWVLLENDDFDDAIKHFDACLVQQPKCTDAVRGRALAIARKIVKAPANDNRRRPRRAG